MKLSPEQKRLLLIVTFVSAVYLYSLNDRLYMYPDSSYYYVIAKSLQDGDGF